MPRPGPRRPILGIRVSEGGIEAIQKRADKAGVSKSEMVRRLLAYAVAKMPETWKP